MSFNVGDCVEILPGKHMKNMSGRYGIVAKCNIDPYLTLPPGSVAAPGVWYKIDCGDMRPNVVERRLRKVPHDPEGRRIVQFDWHQLASPLKRRPAKELQVRW